MKTFIQKGEMSNFFDRVFFTVATGFRVGVGSRRAAGSNRSAKQGAEPKVSARRRGERSRRIIANVQVARTL